MQFVYKTEVFQLQASENQESTIRQMNYK